MKLINIQHDSASIEDCVTSIVLKSRKYLSDSRGYIASSKIDLSFGAFMNLSITLAIDFKRDMRKGILADYSHGRKREDALRKAVENLNKRLPEDAQIVDFQLGTYVTPVTRRTYAVAVVVYNIPMERKTLEKFGISERRALLKRILEEFNYNPRVLNISEIARTFGVSRDSIYYDIEQILKEKGIRRR